MRSIANSICISGRCQIDFLVTHPQILAIPYLTQLSFRMLALPKYWLEIPNKFLFPNILLAFNIEIICVLSLVFTLNKKISSFPGVLKDTTFSQHRWWCDYILTSPYLKLYQNPLYLLWTCLPKKIFSQFSF